MDDDLDRGTEVRWIVSKYGWLSIDRWPEPVRERKKQERRSWNRCRRKPRRARQAAL